MNIILCSENDKKDDIFFFGKDDERYLHITKILKLKTGDFFKAGIINSELGRAQIKDITEKRIIFDFISTEKPHPLYPLHLILGIPRPIQLKRLLKDVSTLGVSSIHLVGTVLGEKSYITSSLIANGEITKYLIEGASQAGSTLLPSYSIYSSLNKALGQEGKWGEDDVNDENIVRLLFDVENEEMRYNSKDKIPLICDSKGEKQIVLAIGSERGWARSERELFKKYNFATVTLGHRIMRCETATIAALSYVLSKIGWDV